jgi:NAD binding domain of 6-phosphogluconate dehydrogenase
VAQAPIREVGFIGLGVMGLPMALNLVRAGVHVTAHSRSPSPVELFVRGGGTGASSTEEAARDKDCIVTMLPDTPDVEKVLLGPRGILESSRRGTVVLDMSTISPLATRQFAITLRTHGLDLVDAPVSGGQAGAENATLSIMVGGSEAAFARVHPILEMLGKTIVHIGESGAGQVAKACNQLIVGVTIEGDVTPVDARSSGRRGGERCPAAPRGVRRSRPGPLRSGHHHRKSQLPVGRSSVSARAQRGPPPGSLLIHLDDAQRGIVEIDPVQAFEGPRSRILERNIVAAEGLNSPLRYRRH